MSNVPLHFASLTSVRNAPVSISPAGEPPIVNGMTPEKRAALNERFLTQTNRIPVIDLTHSRQADFSQEVLSASRDAVMDVDPPPEDPRHVDAQNSGETSKGGEDEAPLAKSPLSPGGAEEHEEEKGRRPRGPNFTPEEDQAILKFAEENGENKWQELIAKGILNNRTAQGVQKRYRVLLKKMAEKDGDREGDKGKPASAPSSIGKLKEKERDKDRDREREREREKEKEKEKEEKDKEKEQKPAVHPFPASLLEKEARGVKRKPEESEEGSATKKPRLVGPLDTLQQKMISREGLTDEGTLSLPFSPSSDISSSQKGSESKGMDGSVKTVDEEKLRLLKENQEIKERMEKLEKELLEKERRLKELDELKNRVEDLSAYKKAAKKTLIELYKAQGETRRREARRRWHENVRKYGRIELEKATFYSKNEVIETFVDGEVFKELQGKLKALAARKEEIKQRKQALKKVPETSATAVEMEILNAQTNLLTAEEKALHMQNEELLQEKVLHLKETRRIREEDQSQLLNNAPVQPVKDARFVITELIGKGGFSEVYKAFDVDELRVVAVKVLQLNPAWSEQRRENYKKHAIREYKIHSNLNHPNIVPLYSVFELTELSFCTVLEYCEGGDLDEHLKRNGSLTVKEARLITVQIFEALKYLHERPQPIIHYDLKPGNILFDKDGKVKLTDFGLSKLWEDPENGALDLTSQGAGTYWYLPPECFQASAPKITPNVDVWSAGVILYQMLIGQKPFAHGVDQREILQKNLINENISVNFPAKPAIPDDAKKFIQLCLTTNPELRPSAKMMSQDPFLDLKGKPKTSK